MQCAIDSSIRHVLLHYHIFKNAGSTLDAILERNFGPALAFLHTRDPNSVLTVSDVLSFLESHKSIRAISSHHLRPPEPGNDAFVFIGVLILRDPIDRLGSMYAYYRASDNDDPLARAAKEAGMTAFLQTLVDEYPNIANNSQVVYLASSGRYTRPPMTADLHKAVEMFSREAVVITTEMFDRSLVAAEYYLRPTFGNLDFSYVSQNVSPGRASSLEGRLAEIKRACGEKLFQTLLDMNKLDLQLVEAANTEIERRFHLVPNSDKRLESFKQRCRAVTQPAASAIPAHMVSSSSTAM